MAALGSSATPAYHPGVAVFTRLRPSRRAARLDAGLHLLAGLVLGLAGMAADSATGTAVCVLAALAAAASWRQRRGRRAAGFRHLQIADDGVWSFARSGALVDPEHMMPLALSRSPLGCVSVMARPLTAGLPMRRVVLWADSMSADAWRRVQASVARTVHLEAGQR